MEEGETDKEIEQGAKSDPDKRRSEYVAKSVVGKATQVGVSASALAKPEMSSGQALGKALMATSAKSIGVLSTGQLLYGDKKLGVKEGEEIAEIEVGEHMIIVVESFSERGEKLSDGTEVKRGDIVGEIHFINNLDPVRPEANLMSEIRTLFRSAKESLTELAQLCEEGDSRLEGVEVFFGISHLAGPAARKLGFDVFPIRNWNLRRHKTREGKEIASENAGENRDWSDYEKNFKTPQFAYISRGRLVSLYGSKKESKDRPSPSEKMEL